MSNWSDGLVSVGSARVSQVEGMPDAYLRGTQRLLKVWRAKYTRNALRSRYYQARYRFKDYGIALPERIRRQARPMIGWPEKAVRALADLSVFEGFDVPGEDTHGVAELVDDNCLDVEVSQAVVSAYIHSCAFLAVSHVPGDTRVTITPRSAEWSAAIWEPVTRQVESALAINTTNKSGEMTGFTVYFPDKVFVCVRGQGRWRVEYAIDNPLGRCPVVPFAYDAQLNRPFGRSRITRPLMALTDIAFRTVVRMEGNAEFYSAPKLWLLGGDLDAIPADTWSSLMSALNGVSADEDGNVPSLQQVSQASMQPHSDMLKTIALLVSAETDLPVNDLGITMDNPASAEAMAEAERKLARTAERQNRRFGRALRTVIEMAVQLRDQSKTRPDGLSGLRPIWAETREISEGARADYVQKLASVSPVFANSDVALSRAGLSFEEIQALRLEEQEARVRDAVDQLRARIQLQTQTATTTDSSGTASTPEAATVADSQAATPVTGGGGPQ